jgi:hypothetical protein
MSKTKNIFFIVYGGFSSRFLLQTDIFNNMLGHGYKIIIVSPNSNDKNFQKDYERPNVVFEFFEQEAIEQIRNTKLYKFFYITRSMVLPKKYGIETLLEKERIFKIKLKNESIVSKLLNYLLIFTAHFLRSYSAARKAFIALEGFIFKEKFHNKIFDIYKPDMMIIADLGTIDKSNFILREARARRVPIVSIILSWDNLTSKGIGSVKPDFAVAWNENMQDELVNYHNIPIDCCFTGGVPHFDVYYKKPSVLLTEDELRIKLDIKSSNKIITFGTSSPSMFKENIRIINFLLEHMDDNSFLEELHLVVRLHPAYITRMDESHVISDVNELTILKEKYPDSLTINKPIMKSRDYWYELPIEDMILIGSLFKHSSLLVTQFSTLMLEAAIFDLPIVNVGFDNFRGSSMKSYQVAERTHLKRILEKNFTRVAKTEKDLLIEINRYLDNSRLEQQERNQIRFSEGGPNKGNAGKAIANHLHSLILNNNG